MKRQSARPTRPSPTWAHLDSDLSLTGRASPPRLSKVKANTEVLKAETKANNFFNKVRRGDHVEGSPAARLRCNSEALSLIDRSHIELLVKPSVNRNVSGDWHGDTQTFIYILI